MVDVCRPIQVLGPGSAAVWNCSPHIFYTNFIASVCNIKLSPQYDHYLTLDH